MVLVLACLVQSCAPAATPDLSSIVPSQNDSLLLVSSESMTKEEITDAALVIASLSEMSFNDSRNIQVDPNQPSAQDQSGFGLVAKSDLSQIPESSLLLVDKNELSQSAEVVGDFYPEGQFSTPNGAFPIFTANDISVSTNQSGGMLEFVLSPKAVGVISGTEVITQSADLPIFHFNIDPGVVADGGDIMKECLKFPVACFCKLTKVCAEAPPSP